MNRIEKALKQMLPREPSRDYVERGLSRLAAALPERSKETRHWRLATIVLAVMLTTSVALNMVMWSNRGPAGGVDTATKNDRSPVEYVAYSILRPEGEFLVHEVRFGTLDEWEVSNE